jgi:hypothetical protein
MDGSRDSAGMGGAIGARPAVVAHRSKPLPALRFTKLDKVFTYNIVAMRGSRFTHLGMAADGGGGWRR